MVSGLEGMLFLLTIRDTVDLDTFSLLAASAIVTHSSFCIIHLLTLTLTLTSILTRSDVYCNVAFRSRKMQLITCKSVKLGLEKRFRFSFEAIHLRPWTAYAAAIVCHTGHSHIALNIQAFNERNRQYRSFRAVRSRQPGCLLKTLHYRSLILVERATKPIATVALSVCTRFTFVEVRLPVGPSELPTQLCVIV